MADLNEEDEEICGPIYESSVRIDDGGSDLTDRFKYKVNALMGNFDPVGVDDERQTGNIIDALTRFPTIFLFTVVGRTGGDEAQVEAFTQEVKQIVTELSGCKDEELYCQIAPRGSKFTRVTLEVPVDSAQVINSIQEELKEMKATVMAY